MKTVHSPLALYIDSGALTMVLDALTARIEKAQLSGEQLQHIYTLQTAILIRGITYHHQKRHIHVLSRLTALEQRLRRQQPILLNDPDAVDDEDIDNTNLTIPSPSVIPLNSPQRLASSLAPGRSRAVAVSLPPERIPRMPVAQDAATFKTQIINFIDASAQKKIVWWFFFKPQEKWVAVVLSFTESLSPTIPTSRLLQGTLYDSDENAAQCLQRQFSITKYLLHYQLIKDKYALEVPTNPLHLILAEIPPLVVLNRQQEKDIAFILLYIRAFSLTNCREIRNQSVENLLRQMSIQTEHPPFSPEWLERLTSRSMPGYSTRVKTFSPNNP